LLVVTLPVGQLPDPGGDFRNELAARKNALGNNLRGGAGRGGSDVGDKIADRKIDFMADGGNHRQVGIEEGARNYLLVKGPQIFEAAAAASDEDQIQVRR